MKGVCFLEVVSEAESFLQACARTEFELDELTVVALTIEVRAYLGCRGVDCVDTTTYFKNEHHRNAIEASKQFSEILDLHLDLTVSDPNLRQTYQQTAVFHVQYFINYFLFITSVVENVLVDLSPSYVVCSRESSADFRSSDDLPLIVEEDAFACRIVAPYCRLHDIEYRLFDRSDSRAESRPTQSWTGGRAPQLLLRLLARSTERGVDRIVYLGGGGTNDEAIAKVLDRINRKATRIQLGPSILDVVQQLAQVVRGRPDRFRMLPAMEDSSVFGDHVKNLDERLADPFTGSFEGELQFRGIDFWECLGFLFQARIRPFLVAMSGRIQSIIEAMDRFNPKYIIATGVRYENYAIGEWARRQRVPFVLVSHGTTIRPKNEWEEIENESLGKSLQLSDVVTVGVLQTPIEEAHVDYFGGPPSLVKAGPILFRNWKTKRKKRVPEAGKPIRIMLASSYKSKGSLRFWAMETPDEYLQSCRDLVSAVNSLDFESELVIRFHAKLTIPTDSFRALLPDTDRLKIDRGGRFLDSLDDCDIVVNFSSTSIEESLQNNVPVLLYDRWNRYKHCEATDVEGGARLSPDAVYYLGRPELLAETLAGIADHVKNGSFENGRYFVSYQYPEDYLSRFTDLFESA